MGIFSKLFGRRQSTWEPAPPPPPPAPKISAEQQAAVDALLEKMGGGDLAAWVAPAPPPRAKKSRKPQPARPVEMVETKIETTHRFEFRIPAAQNPQISALGQPNPKYSTDVRVLKRNKLLFEDVYELIFPAMAAELSAAPGKDGDPDAVTVSVGGVVLGEMEDYWGAMANWWLRTDGILSAKAEISGGGYVTVDCYGDYDENSKNIPLSALDVYEYEDGYRAIVTIELREKAAVALEPAKKISRDYMGVDSALPGCKQMRFSVDDSDSFMDTILSFGTANPDFLATPEFLAEKGLCNMPVYSYDFPEVEVVIAPMAKTEPGAEKIQVTINGKLAGYVPNKKCQELIPLMRHGGIERVQGCIHCEDLRMLAAPGTGAGASPEQMRIYRKYKDISVKVFVDITK